VATEQSGQSGSPWIRHGVEAVIDKVPFLLTLPCLPGQPLMLSISRVSYQLHPLFRLCHELSAMTGGSESMRVPDTGCFREGRALDNCGPITLS
jgi:hypothetical protein